MTCWVKSGEGALVDLSKATWVRFDDGDEGPILMYTEVAQAADTGECRIMGDHAVTAWAEFERYVGRERIKTGHDRDLAAEGQPGGGGDGP